MRAAPVTLTPCGRWQIGSLEAMHPRYQAALRDVQRLRQEQAELRGSLGTVRRASPAAVKPCSMTGTTPHSS